jgi:hypothetical protein
MNKLVMSLISIFSLNVAFAGGISPEERVSDVIRLLKANKPTEAFDKAFSGNELIKDKKSELEQLKYQFAGFVAQVGAPYDCEPLISRSLLERYRIEQFLCLSEMQPFVIQFDFYRPRNEWKIQAFSFNTDVDNHIEEDIKFGIGKISRLED